MIDAHVHITIDPSMKARMATIFENYGVVFAYLFGSQARGVSGPLSDIDVALYLGETVAREQWFDLRLKVLGELSDLLKTDALDLVVLNEAPPLLAHRILKEGRLLFCADLRVRLEFEANAVLKYLDWKPYLEKYARQVFGCGARCDG